MADEEILNETVETDQGESGQGAVDIYAQIQKELGLSPERARSFLEVARDNPAWKDGKQMADWAQYGHKVNQGEIQASSTKSETKSEASLDDDELVTAGQLKAMREQLKAELKMTAEEREFERAVEDALTRSGITHAADRFMVSATCRQLKGQRNPYDVALEASARLKGGPAATRKSADDRPLRKSAPPERQPVQQTQRVETSAERAARIRDECFGPSSGKRIEKMLQEARA